MSEWVTQAERDAAAERLSIGYVEGAFSTDTFEANRATVLAAKTRTELDRGLCQPPGRLAPIELVVMAEEESLVLGRSSSCERTFDDENVSRHHALLRLRSARDWCLMDLASTNGTWVNGRQIIAPVTVVDGDEVRLGRLQVKLRLPE